MDDLVTSNGCLLTRRGVLQFGAAALLTPRRTWPAGNVCKLGVAETTITPSWSTPLWGYGYTFFSQRVLDELSAKAFLFDSGKRFLLLTADVGAIGFITTRRIARRLHEEMGIDEDAVNIQVTHDHYAPALLDIPELPADQRFKLFLEDKLVALAHAAQKNLTAASFEFGQVDSFLGLNRRTEQRHQSWDQPSGPIDPKMSVLLARSPEGKNLGVLVNYAAHPVMMPDKTSISADFPGVLYRELGASLHCPVMYSQGCAGDVIPKVVGGPKEKDDFGKRMAGEAERALAAAKPLADPTISYASKRVVVTFVAPWRVDEFRANYPKNFEGVPDYFHSWAERYLRYLEDGGDIHQSRDTIVRVFSIGDLSFAFLPGEILHLTSLLIRREFPQRKLIVGAYANDTSVGYLPHADEFPKGGYEIDNAWRFYGTLKTTPQMEQDVREAAVILLRSLP